MAICFEEKMKCKDFLPSGRPETPRFVNYDLYSRILPTVTRAQNSLLFELPFWAPKNEMDELVARLHTRGAIAKRTIRYITGPEDSGKTSSVIAAFLHSATTPTPFTHYLYLSFDNADMRYQCAYVHHKADKWPVEKARKLGGRFIYNCMLWLLRPDKDIKETKIFPIVDDTSRAQPQMESLISSNFGLSRVLIHVDGLSKVCVNKEFGRGALQCLAQVDMVTVVNTDSVKPFFPPSHKDSSVRLPVSIPSLDVDQLLQGVIPELAWERPKDALTNMDWTCLRFRLACRLHVFGLYRLHDRADPDFKKFLTAFQEAAQANDMRKAGTLCRLGNPRDVPVDINVIRFLLGVEERYVDSIHPRPFYVIVANNDPELISYNFLRFLQVQSEEPVYNHCRAKFMRLLASDCNAVEMAPLAMAYLWTISCMLVEKKKLEVAGEVFEVEGCYDLVRIDPLNPPTQIKSQVMYFADYDPTTPAPIADFFFRSTKGVVMVDIVAGGEDKVLESVKRLANWVGKSEDLFGVVIAPRVEQPLPSAPSRNVLLATGKDALRLLGGLKPAFHWLTPTLN